MLIKRILIVFLVITIFVLTVLFNLYILDILTVDVLRESIGKILLVIAVTTLAMILIVLISEHWKDK